MTISWIDQLGEWNPQLVREIKGRFKPRNISIAVATSLVGQLLVLMSFAGQLPVADERRRIVQEAIYSRYCTGVRQEYSSELICISDNLGSFVINWQLWWKDVFAWLSIIGIFTLLLVGVYMLISDLSKEEQRGTLNFIRLSPQPSQTILLGKMLGVPVLLYLVGLLALPLNLVSGLAGQISISVILGFYAVLATSCLFFYSLALLFGLAIAHRLGGFQAWLGSGVVLMFLWVTTAMTLSPGNIITHYPADWVTLFSPLVVLDYLRLETNFLNNTASYDLQDLRWYYLPVSASVWSAIGFMLLNYGVWTYWIWQGLKRCFHNPTATLLSKQQSYWLTATFEAVILGFALNPDVTSWRSYSKGLFENFQMLLVFNLMLFLCLIVVLSPHRQAMQDWARYRHQMRSTRKKGIMSDLIWGEKSPSVVAIGLNLAIASVMLLTWIVFWPENEYQIPALSGLLLNCSVIFIYAVVAQLMLFMKAQKRVVWAAITVGSLVVLPPVILGLLSIAPTESEHALAWMFSAFPWAVVENATGMSVFLAIIGQSLITGLLTLQLTRQLQKAGESSTKALLSGRSSAIAR
ncbi:MAG TPA: hypothetical protein V6D50_07890 [Chroococcales cyanobacterium]